MPRRKTASSGMPLDRSHLSEGCLHEYPSADHSADVVKVEPPAGDETRDWGPPFHEEDAAYFVGVNRNKRSIGLDLASEGGRAVLMRMLEDADVLVENFKPGTLDKWGIGNDVLRAKFPKLVHCRISGFGGDGPRGG